AHGGRGARLPDVAAAATAGQALHSAIEAFPAAVAAARATGLTSPSRHAKLHIDLAQQVTGLPGEDSDLAARWITIAAAPDSDALDVREALLPPIPDPREAEQRLAGGGPCH